MAVGAAGSLWGWNAAKRRMLAVLALVPAIWLSCQGGGRPTPIDPKLVIDPNTAPTAVLTALPRIGPVLAGRIVAARAERPLRSPGDLDDRVRGVGPATLDA